jgi:4-hydroxy-4-methyl-2-oxoglutarate aldolase
VSIQDDVVNFIRDNRVSTTEVADALGKQGVLPDVLPVNHGKFAVGPIRPIFAAFESNYAVHEQVRETQRAEIPVVFTHETAGRAVLGELVSKFILLYRASPGLVVDGPIRDVAAIRRHQFAVWSAGHSPIGCFNRPAAAFPTELESSIREKYQGGIAVCDDGGVVLIERCLVNEELLHKLHRIEMQEDIWFFCLDTLKWDTKKIVCDKAYLTETDLLASAHLKQLGELSKPLDQEK